MIIVAEILQLKIGIQGISDCQRILIESKASFQRLHQFIQEIYEWENHHLHEFIVNEMVRIAPENGESIRREMIENNLHRDDETLLSEEETPLSKYLNMKGDSLVYRYDFGDDWRYDIVLEKIKEEKYIEEYDDFPVKFED